MAELELCSVNYIYNKGTPYETHALKDINLKLGGGITGIIGHTGSGKSTMVQMFNGLVKPTTGTVKLDGKNIFIRPHTQGYESLLWVNGEPFGTFATKIVFTGHGNHYCDLLKMNVKAGEKIDIALEVYAGHPYKGCDPLENQPLLDYVYTFNGMDICVKDYEIQEFYFDLKVINELVETLDEYSFRRGDIVNALYDYLTDSIEASEVSEIGISCQNHMLVFAAEKSRATNTVVDVEEFINSL